MTEQLVVQCREWRRVCPSSSKPPSVAGDGMPVVEEADSVPWMTKFLRLLQAVDARSSWLPPDMDIFVENSDSTKRVRVMFPSLLVEAVESGQFDEGDAKRMVAALCKMGVAASPDAVPPS